MNWVEFDDVSRISPRRELTNGDRLLNFAPREKKKGGSGDQVGIFSKNVIQVLFR